MFSVDEEVEDEDEKMKETSPVGQSVTRRREIARERERDQLLRCLLLRVAT